MGHNSRIMRLSTAFAIIMTAVTVASAQQPDLRTRAEITNYEETSSYDDVRRVIDGLVASSPLVHTESFGKTEEGRDMPLLVISEPKVTPQAAHKLGRPLVSCGPTSTPRSGRQEAVWCWRAGWCRAISSRSRNTISSRPIQRRRQREGERQNRTAQDGPGENHNRDYMKLDSEARSLVS
jgi:hypothetical protein